MTAGMALNGIPIQPYNADYFDQRKIKDLAKVSALIYTKETQISLAYIIATSFGLLR